MAKPDPGVNKLTEVQRLRQRVEELEREKAEAHGDGFSEGAKGAFAWQQKAQAAEAERDELRRVVAGEVGWHLDSRCPTKAEVRRLEGLIAQTRSGEKDSWPSDALFREWKRIREREARPCQDSRICCKCQERHDEGTCCEHGEAR